MNKKSNMISPPHRPRSQNGMNYVKAEMKIVDVFTPHFSISTCGFIFQNLKNV